MCMSTVLRVLEVVNSRACILEVVREREPGRPFHRALGQRKAVGRWEESSRQHEMPRSGERCGPLGFHVGGAPIYFLCRATFLAPVPFFPPSRYESIPLELDVAVAALCPQILSCSPTATLPFKRMCQCPTCGRAVLSIAARRIRRRFTDPPL